MMKKNILAVALLSSALVIGTGVALAHGMRGATEVEAATETTVYLAISDAQRQGYTVKLNVNRQGDADNWAQYTMTATGATYDSKPVYTYTFTDVYDGLGKLQFQLYDGSTWKEQDEAISSWTAVGNYNGKLHVYGVSGWVAYEAPEDNEADHVFKLVGDGTEALGGWSKESSTLTMSAAGVSGYLKKIESVPLAVNDEFKVVDVNLNNWYGDSFLATDATRAKFDIHGGNFQVLTAGTYDVYIKDSANGHKVAILTHGEDLANVKEETPVADGYYLLGVGGDWTTRHGIADDKDGLSENYAEFHNVALALNDTFKVAYVDDGAATDYYGYESFVNLTGGADMTGKIEEAASDQNFEVKTAGTYSIYLFDDNGDKKISIYDENYSEVYKAYLDGVEAGTLTVNPSNEHELMLTDVDVTAGDELVIKFNGTPLTVSPKAGDGNNVAISEEKLVIRQTANDVGMYLSKNAMEAWEVWVDGYVTSDIEVVDNFVATYITPYIDEAWKSQTADQRVASCTEKYNRAKTAYDGLTQDQKDLFAVNARYSEAYAVYTRWASVVGGGAIISVKGLNDTSKAAAVIGAVSVGAIAAAAGFVFLRKRKNNA